MGAGRFICVAIPFILTFASLVCMLIAGLSGITNKNLDLFVVNTTNLSISSSSFQNLENIAKRANLDPLSKRATGDLSSLTTAALSPNVDDSVSSTVSSITSGTNITAADLSLADAYKITLWGYCSVTGTNTTCTKGKFNWAASTLNTTTITTLATTNGVNATLPKEVTSSLKTFIIVARWTEIVYIIAIIALACELVFGLLAFCSSCGSCLTWLLSGISTTTVTIASVLATVMSTVVVGVLKSTAKAYGVEASINASFLAVTWLGVAFSMAAGMFWFFTICCCKVDHRSAFKNNRGSNRGFGGEKGLTGAFGGVPATGQYQRVHDPNDPQNFGRDTQYHGVVPAPVGHKQGAYEPYARGAV